MSYLIQKPLHFLSLPLALSGLALGVAACNPGQDGANPTETQEQIQTHLPGLIDSTLESADFLESNEAWNNLSASLGAFDAVLGLEEDVDQPLPASLTDEEPSGQELADMLTTEIFTEANYQGDGVFALPASLVCPDIEIYDEQSPDGFVFVPDQECIDGMASLDLRIHVQSAGDGLDFGLLVGPGKARPLSLELRSDRLSLATDLQEVKATVQHLASLAPAEEEEIRLPERMEGVAAISLIRHAAKDISIELAIREEIAVEGSIPGLGDLRFSTAAATPLAALRLNGLAETLTASIDLNRTQLSAPWSAMDEFSNASGILDVDWQGLSASVELGDASGPNLFAIRNIGLGDGQSTVKLDGATLLAFDLNADSGRHFDLLMETPPAQGLPTFRFVDKFKLEVLTDLSPLAAAGDDIDASLLDQTYTIEVEEGMQAVEGSEGAGLKAIGGAIRIGSTKDQSNVLVPAGQCLLPSPLEVGEHEIIGALTAGACPQS